MRNEQEKRIAVIQDFSGAGKCSMTIALPVLSALGCETAGLPTAVLSTHTGFPSPVMRDLSDLLLPAAQQWCREGAVFEAALSGYLGSAGQVETVTQIFQLLREKNPNIRLFVDPAMADHGKLYRAVTPETAERMRRLCAAADVIFPNLTEACLLTDTPYSPEGFSRAAVEQLLEKLCRLCNGQVVLTGVSFSPEETGAACKDSRTGAVRYSTTPRLPGAFHGTGDLFAAVTAGAMLRGLSLPVAVDCAVWYTAQTIQNTIDAGQTDRRWGIKFEKGLGCLMKRVDSLANAPGTLYNNSRNLP